MLPIPHEFEKTNPQAWVSDIQIVGIDDNGIVTEWIDPDKVHSVWFMVKYVIPEDICVGVDVQITATQVSNIEFLFLITNGEVWYGLEHMTLPARDNVIDYQAKVTGKEKKPPVVPTIETIQAAIKLLITEIEGQPDPVQTLGS